jgi:hypothetical protein
MKWWSYWGLVILGFGIGTIGYKIIHSYDLYGLGVAIMFITIGYYLGLKKAKEK